MKFDARLLLAIDLKNSGEKNASLSLFTELNEQVDDMLESSHINYTKIKCFMGMGLYSEGKKDEAFKYLKEGT